MVKARIWAGMGLCNSLILGEQDELIKTYVLNLNKNYLENNSQLKTLTDPKYLADQLATEIVPKIEAWAHKNGAERRMAPLSIFQDMVQLFLASGFMTVSLLCGFGAITSTRALLFGEKTQSEEEKKDPETVAK